MLRVVNDNGFQLTFANGYTISVMFGRGHYCSNRYQDNDNAEGTCDNAEIAVWDENGDSVLIDGQREAGWLSPDEIASWINKVRGWR